MKKIILIAIAFIGLQATAQQRQQGPNKRDGRQKMMNLSAEEIATLQTKKMTLFLDLNESQQTQIMAINLENAKARKAHMEARKAKKEAGNTEKPTQEERLKMMNARLDHKIEMKAKMKNILNDEQYAKWEKAQMRMAKKGKDNKKGQRQGKKKQRQ